MECMIMTLSKDKAKLRNKVITEGKTEMNRKIRDGSYIDELRRSHGVLGDSEVILDKEFLEDIKKEIGKNRIIEEIKKKRKKYEV